MRDLTRNLSTKFRAEFERLNRQQLEQNVENLVKSKGELTVLSDARVLFLSDSELERLGGPDKLGLVQRLQTVQQRQIFLKHNFTTPISPSTAIVATTQVLARQGQGAGNLLLKLQHNPSSKVSLEIGTTVLRPRALTFKTTYAPSSDTFTRVEVPFRSLSQPPKFTCTLGRLIYPNTTGTITFRSGAWALGPWGSDLLQPYSDSSLSVGLSHTSGWGLEATNTVFVKQVAISYGRTVLGGVRLELAGVVTNVGATSVSISADRRVTENIKAGMGVEVAASGAMTVKLRRVDSCLPCSIFRELILAEKSSFNRLGQRINLPILIASGFDARLFAGFTLLPAVGIIAANHFVLEPRKRKRVSGCVAFLFPVLLSDVARNVALMTASFPVTARSANCGRSTPSGSGNDGRKRSTRRLSSPRRPRSESERKKRRVGL